jgi:glycosyltransferase involved in cell wall biosynthesis
MAAGLPVALASLLRGIPFILKFVGDEAWERATQSKLTSKRLEEFLENPEGGLKIKLMLAIQGFVLRRASIVTTPSAYLKDEIVKTYRIKPERAVVNYNAAEETEILPFEITRKPHQIATTARLTSWKGVDGIIRATAILKKRIPDIHFKIAGDGPEMENLKELSRTLNIEDCVEFLGKISRAETWRLRKESEIYVLNSTYEGLPHTVLTSFAAEIPTVATDIPGTNEAIYHEKTGLLVKTGDDKGLADAIERLINDKALQNTVVENGRKLLKEKFSWDAHIETLNSFFNSVVFKPRD